MPVIRALLSIGIILLYLLAPLAAAAAEAEAELTLEAALRVALDANPTLAQARARAEAMAAISPQAGALPDPRLTLGALNVPVDTYRFDQEPMTQVQVGLSQEFPSFGKRGLRRGAARHDALAAGEEAEEMRLRLVRDVRSAWWQLIYLDRAREIIARNRELLGQFVRIAETKYKVGRGMQQDVLLAQLELSRLIEMDLKFRSNRHSQQARLNSLLNRPPSDTIKLPARVPDTLVVADNEEALIKAALESRPLLIARRNQVEAARARLKLADKDYTPNLMVGAAYGFRDGTNPNGSERPDFASLQISMNLPLYAGSRQGPAVTQRTAELAERERALEDSQQQVSTDIVRGLADYTRASDQSVLFRTGIIPQANQTVASMLAAYQVNKVDFLNLVRAQLTLYTTELQYWQALSEAHQALAALDAAVGKEQNYE
jgi:outer membrane protein TolC